MLLHYGVPAVHKVWFSQWQFFHHPGGGYQTAQVAILEEDRPPA
jgi:hypothetical protein